MSRWRFPLLVALVAVVVAAGAFAIGLQVLDDGEPDPPPRTAATEGAAADGTGETTTTATTSVIATGALPTPAWIVVVASEDDEATATARADAVGDRGHPVGVLRSDDYPSLNPGLWVAYAGPFADAAEATAVKDALTAEGVAGTYVRCAGTAEQCRGDDG